MNGALPLRYARRNLLFGRAGEVSALYRLPMVSYPCLPAGDKLACLRTLAGFAFQIGADFSLWRVSRVYPAGQYVAQAAGLVDRRHAAPDAWRRFLAGHAEWVERLQAHVPELYAAVTLDHGSGGQAATGGQRLGAARRAVDRARRRVEDLAGVGSAQPVSGAELQLLAEEEALLHERMVQLLPGVERATTRDLQWLLRRAACRGVAEPELDRWWQPAALMVETANGEISYQPRAADILRHVNAQVHEADRRLVVDSEEGCSHQALLALGAMPEEAVFPGSRAELLFAPLDAVDFPVDAVLHARWIDNRTARSQAEKKVREADSAYEDELGTSHAPGRRSDENRALARDLQDEVDHESRPPLLDVAISFALGAPTETELERRVSALRERFGDVRLYRPAGLQLPLYLEHLPRCDSELADYWERLTTTQFGALVPFGTRTVGSTAGPLIGYTTGEDGRPRTPVRFDSTEAPRTGRVTTVLCAGTLGSGKTIAAQLLALLAAMRGSAVLTVDPKPDHRIAHLPELARRSQIIELSSDPQFRGVLDPLRIAPVRLREEITADYLCEILPGRVAGEWQTEIKRAIRDVVRAGGNSCGQVLAQLRAAGNPNAAAAARALELEAEFGLGQLAFAGTETAQLQLGHVTTIRMAGVELPQPDVPRREYTRSDVAAVATLKLLAAYAMRLIEQDSSWHKLIVFDEAWVFLNTRQGRALLNQIVRLGRSKNATVVLATQTLGEIGGLDALLGTRLIFGQESVAEARRCLELLGLDADDRQLTQRLLGFRRGRCLMRDLDGRVSEVQIHPVYRHILETLDTSPGAHREIEEVSA